MTRIILLALVIGLIANLIRVFVQSIKHNTCSNCNGKGYWRETRGEKNICKTCDGYGYIDK